MSESPFARLDLAPKLNRPLRLWWPPDYLRLLYWVFFFPQAVTWYEARFGKPEYFGARGRKAATETLRSDSVRRNLMMQAVLCVCLTAPAISGLLSVIGVPVAWTWVLVGVILGLVTSAASGIAMGMVNGVVLGIFVGVAFGITISVAICVTFGAVLGVAGTVVGVVAVLWATILALIIVSGVVVGARGSIALPMASLVSLGALFVSASVWTAVSIGMLLDLGDTMLSLLFEVDRVTLGVTGVVGLGAVIGVVFGVSMGVAVGRLLDWLLLGLPTRLVGKIGGVSRMIWLPLPGVQRDLEARFDQDWLGGIQDVIHVFAYSLQFIPAVKAINAALATSSDVNLVARISVLVFCTYDWDVVRYGSTNLANGLWQELLSPLDFAPRRWIQRWRTRFPVDPCLDTPAHAACAGFWHWHEGEAEQAMNAFAAVRHIPNGMELHDIPRAIAAAQVASSLDTVMVLASAYDWLEALPDPELRSGTLKALRVLRQAAEEARVARHSVSILSRSAALGRANGLLTRLIETGEETCLQPEWPLIKKIAEQWRDIISKAGGVVGEEVLRQPALNPYEGYSGLPVIGPTFVGREKILRHIEDRWAGGAQPPPLILFGHRRMGKSSILRNLGRIAGTNTIVVYLDMQDTGWVDHTEQLLLDFAEAIQREAGLASIPKADQAAYADLDTARRSFNALLDQLDGRMTGRRLILAVDEYELIEEGIRDHRIDPELPGYLRSKMAHYRWLALIFAGLHTLDEMGQDYRSAFYGAAEHIRVGYLSHDDTIRLITQPHPEFTLEYELELREELYRLTYGQPYLLQRICWELVTRWNERFLKERESTPRILTMDDLAAILTPDFYQAAGYYFEGVWSNVTETERQLMRVMADETDHVWLSSDLAAAAGLPEEAVHAGLKLLRDHDVIVDESDGVRFAAELMRRWVAMHQATPLEQATAK